MILEKLKTIRESLAAIFHGIRQESFSQPCVNVSFSLISLEIYFFLRIFVCALLHAKMSLMFAAREKLS